MRLQRVKLFILVTSLFGLVIFLSASRVDAQQITNTTIIRTVFASEQLTVGASSTGFTSATYNPTIPNQPQSISQADNAIMICEANGQSGANAQIRLLDTGSAVTATTGFVINPGDVVQLFGFGNISQVTLIRAGTTSVTCDVEYLRISSKVPR